MITFGVQNKNGYSWKVCVNPATKEFEAGQVCVNTCNVNVWLKTKKDLNALVKELDFEGYTKIEGRFSNR